MLKNKLMIIALFTLIFITGCSQNLEKQIIGTWQAIEDDCDTNMGKEITFYENNEISGIEGFETYKYQKNKDEDYDYAILSGDYEDATKYRVQVNKNNLSIVYEEEDIYDFDSAIACHMERISD